MPCCSSPTPEKALPSSPPVNESSRVVKQSPCGCEEERCVIFELWVTDMQLAQTWSHNERNTPGNSHQWYTVLCAACALLALEPILMSEFDNMCTHVELHIISTKCKNEKTNVASWRKMNDSHPQVGRYWHFGLVTDPTCFNGDGCNFRIKCISLLVIISASLPRRGSVTGINTLHAQKWDFYYQPTHSGSVTCFFLVSCISERIGPRKWIRHLLLSFYSYSIWDDPFLGHVSYFHIRSCSCLVLNPDYSSPQ